MSLIDWAATWVRKPKPVREYSIVATETPRAKPRVPAEYLSLYTYLEHRYAETVVLTFDQMETLLGFVLPPSACTESGWWTGPALRHAAHSDAWTMASRIATPNLLARTVRFERRPVTAV